MADLILPTDAQIAEVAKTSGGFVVPSPDAIEAETDKRLVQDSPAPAVDPATVQSSIMFASRENPEALAQNLELSRKAGLPLGTTERNAKDAKALAFQQENPVDAFKDYPVTGKFLGDKVAAALLANHYEDLRRREDQWNYAQSNPARKSRTLANTARDVYSVFPSTLASLATASGVGANALSQLNAASVRDYGAPDISGELKVGSQTLFQIGDFLSQAAQQIHSPENQTNPYVDVASSLVASVGTAGAVGAERALAALTAVMGGQAAQQMRDQGVDITTPENEAKIAAAAALMGQMEKFQVGRLVGGGVSKTAIGRVLENTLTGAVVEGAQQVTQNVAEKSVGLDTPVLGSVGEQGYYGGIAEGGMRAVVELMAGRRLLSRKMTQKPPAEYAADMQEIVAQGQTPKGVSLSKILGGEPSQAHAQAVMGDAKTYVDAEALFTHYQTLSPEDKGRIDARIPNLAKQIEEGAVTAAPVEMNLADFTSVIAPTKGAEALVEHMKPHPQGYSVAEEKLAEDHLPMLNELLAKENTVTRTDVENMKSMLLEAGASKAQAGHVAELLSVRGNIAQRMGLTIEDLNPNIEFTKGTTPAPSVSPEVSQRNRDAFAEAYAKELAKETARSGTGAPLEPTTVQANAMAAAQAGIADLADAKNKTPLSEAAKKAAKALGIKPSRKAIAEHLRASEKILSQGEKTKIQGNITFDPDLQRVVIAVTENADATTWSHEVGHYGSLLLRKAAKMAQEMLDTGNIPSGTTEEKLKQVIADWNDLKAWATGDENAAELNEAAEERIADGFLKYLESGVAPNTRLQPIFDRFVQWFTGIVRTTFLDQGKPVSPEVKAIYDRWLLADGEVNDATEEPYNLVTAIASQFGAELPKGIGKYFDKGKSKARAAFVGELYEAKLAEQRAEYKSTRDNVHEGFKEEAQQRREFALETFVLANKLDAKAVEAVLSKEDFASLTKRGARFFGGTLTPDQAAEAFNQQWYDAQEVQEAYSDGELFSDGLEMLQTLITNPNAEAWAEQRTAEAMKKIWPNDIVDRGIADEYARMYAANSDIGKALDMLAGAANAKKLTTKVLKILARKHIDTLPVYGLRPDRYLAARDKALREALRKGTIGKGGDSAALIWTALVNHNMAQAAAEAKLYAHKTQKTWNKFILRNEHKARRVDLSLAKKYDTPTVDKARMLLARIGIGQRTIPQGASLADTIRQGENPADLVLIQDALNCADKSPVSAKDLTLREFKAYEKAVGSLLALAKAKVSMRVAEENVEFGKIAKSVANVTRDLAPTKEHSAMVKRLSALFRTMPAGLAWRRLRNSVTEIQHYVNFIESTSEEKPISGVMALAQQALTKASDENADITKRLVTVIGPNLKRLGTPVKLSTKHLWRSDVMSADGKPLADAHRAPTIDTMNDLFTLVAHMGTESNFQKMCDGFGWDIVQTDFWLRDTLIKEGVLTEADFDLVQEILDIYEELFPQLNAASIAATGAGIDKVPARQIETPWKTYAGGYSPMNYDNEFIQEKRFTAGDDLEQAFGIEAVSAGEIGSLNTRVEGFSAPVALGLHRTIQNIHEHINYIHVHPAVVAMHRLFQRQDIKASFGRMDSDFMDGVLLPWLLAVRTQTDHSGERSNMFSIIAKGVRVSVGAAKMVANLGNILAQPSDITSVIPYTDAKHVGAATRAVIADIASSATKFQKSSIIAAAQKESAVLHRRAEVYTDGIQKSLIMAMRGDNRLFRARQWQLERAMFGQRITQTVADAIAYEAAKAYAIDVLKYTDEEQIIPFAESVVVKAFGDMAAQNKAPLFRKSGELWKTMLQFGGWGNSKNNAVYWGAKTILRKRGGLTPAAAGEIAYLFTVASLIPVTLGSVVIGLITGNFPPEDEDGDGSSLDDLARWFGWASVTGTLSTVPIAGKIAIEAADYKGKPTSPMNPPVVQTLASAGKAIPRIPMLAGYAAGLLDEPQDVGDTVQSTVDLLSLMFPFATPIGKPLIAATNVWEGDAPSPDNAGDLFRMVTSGKSPK